MEKEQFKIDAAQFMLSLSLKELDTKQIIEVVRAEFTEVQLRTFIKGLKK